MLGQTLIGRYQLTRILGAGGFGQTYLATDLATDLASDLASDLGNGCAQCVVKQLKPASQDASFLAIARRLFETEVKILGKLGDHPQIPRLLGSFEEGNEFYLVQEFIDGQSLEDEIRQAGKFTEAEAIALLNSVLPVLSFIHDHHVVHRDLKPDNLIRRRDTGEIVLIDFGAVKEIRTRLITGERTALTIGIGTQGYTPSEQLSGKPRYSSDIYALGMTVIHALTGRSPTDLPEDLGSLDPCWRDYAEVSSGLAILLDNMIRHYIQQRYPSVAAVQHDLTRLDQLPLEAASASTALEDSAVQARLNASGQSAILRWQMSRQAKYWTVAIATAATSALILGLRQIGVFVPAELAVHDQLVRAQVDPGPDPRLLIVEVSEADWRSPSAFAPSDQAIATAIENLQQYQPAQIGLDLLSDSLPGFSHESLRQSLKAPNVVAITKLSDASPAPSTSPFPKILPGQTSFSNILEDPDFRVRRALMVDFANRNRNQSKIDNNAQPVFALGVDLAIRYLKQYNNIEPAPGDILQLGGVRFAPMAETFGGYRQMEIAGYQMLMSYRSAQNVAARISFADALNRRFDPVLVKDKIVLIGPTTDSSRDLFLTPFSSRRDHQQKMPGVIIHAQVSSQILSAVLDGKPLPWAWPDWAEVAWIIALTGTGSVLMVLTQKGSTLILFGVSGLSAICLISIGCFQAGGWVPMAAPMSAFFVAAAGVRVSKSYQRRYWEARQEATFIFPGDVGGIRRSAHS